MKQLPVAAILVFAAACASSPGVEPGTMPASQTAAADPRVAELQTQLTELLERIDVLNQRIGQLEESRVEPAPVAAASQPQMRRQPAAEPSAPAPRVRQQPQSALIGAEIAESYRQAIMLIGRGRHADARRAFQGVYDADPSGDLADNALFWIGETWFAAKDYTTAVRYYQRVVNEYATENKAPDALFKMAMAQERTGDIALARRTLQQVIERFPYSSPASTAKAELERLRY